MITEPENTSALNNVSLGESTAVTNSEQPNQSPVEKAFLSASKKLENKEKSANNDDVTASSGQDQAASGDSTPTPESVVVNPQTTEAGTSEGNSPDSTLKAPANWDKELVSAFDALPSSEAKQSLLKVYKNLQSGFTQGMQALADEKKAMGELAKLPERFERDPVGELQKLAQALGVGHLFQQPEEKPDFSNSDDPVGDIAKWAAEKAKQELQKETHAELSRIDYERRVESAKNDFTRQLEKASEKYSDFSEYAEPIKALFAAIDGIDPEGAYKIASYDKLKETAAQAPQLQARIAELEKELRKYRVGMTKPSSEGSGHARADDEQFMSPAELAYKRAKAKVSSQRAA